MNIKISETQTWEDVDLVERKIVAPLRSLMHLMPVYITEVNIVSASASGDTDCYAKIDIQEEYLRANLIIGDDLLTYGDEEVWKTLIHELSHMYVNPPIHIWEETTENLMPKETHDLIKNMVRKQAEKSTEALSKAFLFWNPCNHDPKCFGTIKEDK
jgi:hypothetical protein